MTRIRKILIFLVLTVLCVYFTVSASIALNKESRRELAQAKYRVSEYLNLVSEFAYDVSSIGTNYFKASNLGIDEGIESLEYRQNFYYETSDETLSQNVKIIGRGSPYTVERDLKYINIAYILDTFFTDFADGFNQVASINYYSRHNYIYWYSSIGEQYLKNLGFYSAKNESEEILEKMNGSRDILWQANINKNYASQKELIISVPVYDGDEVEGLININYSLEFIDNILNNNFHETYIIDKEGTIISSNVEIANEVDSFCNLKDEHLFGEKKGTEILNKAFNNKVLDFEMFSIGEYYEIVNIVPDNYAMVLYVPRHTYFVSIFSSILSILVIGRIIFWLNDTIDRSRVIRSELNEKYSEVTKLNLELEQVATTDFLTKLYNRRFMLEKLEEQKRLNIVNEEATFVILMMDIDHFKGINDNYGHTAGDEVLKNVSKTIAKNIRSEDLVARWGGEEILVVLINASLEQGNLVAEKIREKVSKTVTVVDGEEIIVTVSIGVEKIYMTNNFDKALTRADTALYKAKTTGRNKVVIYSEDNL